jgi:hypothetical protein
MNYNKIDKKISSTSAIAASKFKYAFHKDTSKHLNFVLAGLGVQRSVFSKEIISSHFLIPTVS